MKRIFNIIIWTIMIFLLLQNNSYASQISNRITLDNLKIGINKEILHPSEEVSINIDFGQSLSEFEVDIAYDKNLFEYISTSNDANIYDNGDIVTITYQTLSSESAVVNSIDVMFKTKSDITSTNPTDFKVTLQNLKNGQTFEVIDNIENPIEIPVIVEPVYTDYKIALSYDGTIEPEEEKEMKLTITSDMGQNYTNTKIYASVISPIDGNAELLANDSEGKEFNFLEEGWGGENGEPIGGKDIVKSLDLRGIFSKEGEYTITIKLVDLNNSDYTIASKIFDVKVGNNNDESLQIGNTTDLENAVGSIASTSEVEAVTNTTEPTILPKAGSTIYFLIVPIGFVIFLIYVLLKKKNDEV